jgi:hypothetical protein
VLSLFSLLLIAENNILFFPLFMTLSTSAMIVLMIFTFTDLDHRRFSVITSNTCLRLRSSSLSHDQTMCGLQPSLNHLLPSNVYAFVDDLYSCRPCFLSAFPSCALGFYRHHPLDLNNQPPIMSLSPCCPTWIILIHITPSPFVWYGHISLCSEIPATVTSSSMVLSSADKTL